jgi:NADH-quinone oxidoreductase subunit J
MSGLDIVFIIIAVMTLVAAFLVVTTKNMVHAALWLVLTLFGVAITFAILNAGFLAVVQVVVYIGAIAILMIFAIMLTRKVMKDEGPHMNKTWWLSALIALVFYAGLFIIIANSGAETASLAEIATDPVADLGVALVSPNAYILPFEIASVLLLAALIGSIATAWKK